MDARGAAGGAVSAGPAPPGTGRDALRFPVTLPADTVSRVSDDKPTGSDPAGTAPPPPPPPDLAPPPGFAASDLASTQRGVSRIGGLAKAIIAATAVVAVATILTAVFSASAAQDATDFLAGDLTEDEFQEAIAAASGVQLVTGVATLATGVLTIMWAFRIANNVRAFGRATTWSPLFAIFGWFLPPMVLYVIPFLVLRELWKASDPTSLDGTDRWKKQSDNPVLWVWFVIFGLVPAVLLVVQIGSFASAGLPESNLESFAEQLEDFGALGWVTALVNTVAAVVWIVFVRQLTARHTQLTHER